MSTKIEDHKGADGRVDWRSLEAAEVAAGKRCYQCNGHIIFGSGGRRLCYECRQLEEDADEVTHADLIRCPHCLHRESVSDSDQYDLYKEDSHAVTCSECEKDFEVSTNVSYSFTSPALVGSDTEDDDADDDAPATGGEGEPRER